ncbi:MAG: nucleoside hydrolase [Armatimonadota bacterium]|nr:MAG: nucleoside hydrolase [Armatimonadota bacterium]
MAELRVILDTDIGDDVDDAYALALLVRSPEVQLEAVTMSTGRLAAKANIARRLLDLGGLEDVPVYRGLPGPGPITEPKQAEWARDHHSRGVIGDEAATELVRRASASPGEIVLLAIGPLTNLGAALDQDPDFGRRLRQLILMGGSLVHGYDYGAKSAEHNIAHDACASQKVFKCGANLVVVPLDATNGLQVTPRRMAQLAVARNPICDALIDLTALCEFEYPTLHDPRACGVLLHEKLGLGVEMRLEVTEDGFTDHVPGDPNCKVILSPGADLLFQLLWERYTAGQAPGQSRSA